MVKLGAEGHVRLLVWALVALGGAAAVTMSLDSLVGEAHPTVQFALAAAAMAATGLGGAIAVIDRARREQGPTRWLFGVFAFSGLGLFGVQAFAYGLSSTGVTITRGLIEALPMVVFGPLLIFIVIGLCWPPRLERREKQAVFADSGTGALGLAVVWGLLVLPQAANAESNGALLVAALVVEFIAIVVVLSCAAAGRRRARLPIHQTVLLQLAFLVYIGADVLGDLLPGRLSQATVTISLLGYVTAAALVAAFSIRGVDEPESARQLRFRDAWSTLIPLSPIPIAAAGLGVSVWLGIDASEPASLAISAMLLLLTAVVMLQRLASRKELRRATVTMAENTFSQATDQAWFQALTLNSRDMVLVVDRRVCVVYASQSLARMVGVAPPELLGRELATVIPDLTEYSVRGNPQTVTGRGASLDVSVLDSDGLDHDVAFHVAPLVGLGFEGFVLTGQDVTDTRRLRRLLGESRRRDRLTGLLNHEGFSGAVQDAQDWSQSRSLAVLVIDLVDYRSLKDARGRRVGDAVLRSMAQLLEQAQGPILAVGRLSSESFGVLVRAAHPEQSVASIARDLRGSTEYLATEEEPVRMRLAMGYAVVDFTGERAGDLLEQADLAAATSSSDPGLNLIRYDEPMREDLLRRWDQISALELALERGEFVPHYQPIIRLSDGVVVAVEALARRKLENGGMQMPDEFIPLAESVGLVERIDQAIRASALRDLSSLRSSFPQLGVSLNVAPVELREGFAAEVMNEVRAAGVPPSSVMFEITESTVARSEIVAQTAMSQLREFGCLVALDDFGTGFSSLAGLRSTEVDVLKIDQSFVSDLATSPRALSLMRAITDVGRGLGLITVAEGVRTVEQADLLRGMGCDRSQGFLHSEALSLEELRSWLGPTTLVSR